MAKTNLAVADPGPGAADLALDVVSSAAMRPPFTKLKGAA